MVTVCVPLFIWKSFPAPLGESFSILIAWELFTAVLRVCLFNGKSFPAPLQAPFSILAPWELLAASLRVPLLNRQSISAPGFFMVALRVLLFNWLSFPAPALFSPSGLFMVALRVLLLLDWPSVGSPALRPPLPTTDADLERLAPEPPTGAPPRPLGAAAGLLAWFLTKPRWKRHGVSALYLRPLVALGGTAASPVSISRRGRPPVATRVSSDGTLSEGPAAAVEEVGR